MSLHRPADWVHSSGVTLAAPETLDLPGLGRLSVRPLTLADRAAYRSFGFSLDREDLRLRFGQPIVLEEDDLCARLLAIDHDREEAFAAVDGQGAIRGVARLVRISGSE